VKIYGIFQKAESKQENLGSACAFIESSFSIEGIRKKTLEAMVSE